MGVPLRWRTVVAQEGQKGDFNFTQLSWPFWGSLVTQRLKANFTELSRPFWAQYRGPKE